MNIIIDGVKYQVKVVYPTHKVAGRLLSGQNSGMSIDFTTIGDVGATEYVHKMEIEPNDQYPEDFDALYWALTAPVQSHRVILPFGQGTQEFDARISVAEITDHNEQDGYRRWRGLAVEYKPIKPQRMG